MSYYSQTGKTIEQAFKEFDKENPAVYDQFKIYFNMLKEKGVKKTSSKMILNRIRFEVYMETTGKPYRINDCFTSHYARKFVKEYPHFKDFFEFRKLKAIEIKEDDDVKYFKDGQAIMF